MGEYILFPAMTYTEEGWVIRKQTLPTKSYLSPTNYALPLPLFTYGKHLFDLQTGFFGQITDIFTLPLLLDVDLADKQSYIQEYLAICYELTDDSGRYTCSIVVSENSLVSRLICKS